MLPKTALKGGLSPGGIAYSHGDSATQALLQKNMCTSLVRPGSLQCHADIEVYLPSWKRHQSVFRLNNSEIPCKKKPKKLTGWLSDPIECACLTARCSTRGSGRRSRRTVCCWWLGSWENMIHCCYLISICYCSDSPIQLEAASG